MNYLLPYQFDLNVGNSRSYRDVFQVIVKMSVAGERFVHVQEVFCEALLEENEVIKNDFDFLCCNTHSEDCLLFLSKKAMFLTR